jgi:chemotaxis protein MotB
MSRRGWVNSGLVVVLILAGGLGLYGYRSLQSDITQLTDARSTAESNAEELRSQLRQNEQALTAARARLEHRTSSADKLESELNRLRQTLAGTKADLQTAQQQVEKLKAQLETAHVALTEREGQVAEQGSQLKQSREQIAAHKVQLAAATKHVESLSQRRDALTSDLNAVLAKQSSAQNQIDDLTTQLTQATGQRQSVAEQYQQAREQLALQQARSESATETINELEARMAQEKAATDNLQLRLQSLSHEKENLVSRLEDGTTVIKLPESIMFNSGSARIGKAGRHTLTLLAEALKSFPDHLISIQGHSDSRSIAPALQSLYPTNWELSASRAASAVRVLREAGIDPSRMQAVGFADTRPLVEEIDADSRRKNRRIEVLLYPSQFKIKAYQPGGREPAR